MPDTKLLALAAALRARSEEVLTQADSMVTADAQDAMRKIARTYQDLAQRLEQHAADIDMV
jgi:hypothetical protein